MIEFITKSYKQSDAGKLLKLLIVSEFIKENRPKYTNERTLPISVDYLQRLEIPLYGKAFNFWPSDRNHFDNGIKYLINEYMNRNSYFIRNIGANEDHQLFTLRLWLEEVKQCWSKYYY